jgi:ABC-type nitrate/sulfonate/bicarbonate transport system permease component
MRGATVPAVTGDAIRRRRANSLPLPRWANWVSPILVLLFWEFTSRVGLVDRRIVPPPTEIAATLAMMIAHEGFLAEIGKTLARFLTGLSLGVLAGATIGLTMGLYRWPRVLLQPLVSILYPLPHIALFPIVLILVGQNEYSNLLMVTLGPFFTMVIVATTAVRNIEPIFLDVAASFETDIRDLYARIILPAALPQLAAAFRISLGLALVSTIAVEFLVAEDGIGHVIWNSWTILSLSRSVGGLATTGVIGFIAFSLFAWLERRIIPWQATSK